MKGRKFKVQVFVELEVTVMESPDIVIDRRTAEMFVQDYTRQIHGTARHHVDPIKVFRTAYGRPEVVS